MLRRTVCLIRNDSYQRLICLKNPLRVIKKSGFYVTLLLLLFVIFNWNVSWGILNVYFLISCSHSRAINSQNILRHGISPGDDGNPKFVYISIWVRKNNFRLYRCQISSVGLKKFHSMLKFRGKGPRLSAYLLFNFFNLILNIWGRKLWNCWIT